MNACFNPRDRRQRSRQEGNRPGVGRVGVVSTRATADIDRDRATVGSWPEASFQPARPQTSIATPACAVLSSAERPRFNPRDRRHRSRLGRVRSLASGDCFNPRDRRQRSRRRFPDGSTRSKRVSTRATANIDRYKLVRERSSRHVLVSTRATYPARAPELDRGQRVVSTRACDRRHRSRRP